MLNQDVLNHAKKIGLSLNPEESILAAVSLIDNSTERLLPPPILVGFYQYIPDPRFRSALRRYQKYAGSLIGKYGDPNDYAVLNLHSSSSAKDVDEVSKDIELIHRVRLNGENPLVLLSNEEVISRLEPELRELGFEFSIDWKDERSDYKRLLRAALDRGTIYDMIKSNEDFSFARVRDSSPKSYFISLHERLESNRKPLVLH